MQVAEDIEVVVRPAFDDSGPLKPFQMLWRYGEVPTQQRRFQVHLPPEPLDEWLEGRGSTFAIPALQTKIAEQQLSRQVKGIDATRQIRHRLHRRLVGHSAAHSVNVAAAAVKIQMVTHEAGLYSEETACDLRKTDFARENQS